MVTTASKFFFAGAVTAVLAAMAYGIGTDGDLVGVATVGLKGPVGDLTGYSVLLLTAAVLLGLGAASSILRDADPEAQAAVARLEALPPVVAPAGPAYWPILGALSVVVGLVGLVASPVLFVIGALGLLLVVLEWMVAAWSERATGDATVNRQIRNRLMFPIEIPLAAALGILVLVVSVSRILLTLPKNGSSLIAIVLAAVMLAGGFLFSYRPTLSRDLVAGLLTVLALAVLIGGIVSAVSGPRDFEHHEEEGGSETHEPTHEPGYETGAGVELPALAGEGEG